MVGGFRVRGARRRRLRRRRGDQSAAGAEARRSACRDERAFQEGAALMREIIHELLTMQREMRTGWIVALAHAVFPLSALPALDSSKNSAVIRPNLSPEKS